MQIAFPFHVDDHGQIATADDHDHVVQLIEQVLFTSPGERVNRPDFGCGLAAFLFQSPTGHAITALQGIVQGSLQRWLGDVLHVEAVIVAMEDAELVVEVRYTERHTGQRHVSRFTQMKVS